MEHMHSGICDIGLFFLDHVGTWWGCSLPWDKVSTKFIHLARILFLIRLVLTDSIHSGSWLIQVMAWRRVSVAWTNAYWIHRHIVVCRCAAILQRVKCWRYCSSRHRYMHHNYSRYCIPSFCIKRHSKNNNSSKSLQTYYCWKDCAWIIFTRAPIVVLLMTSCFKNTCKIFIVIYFVSSYENVPNSRPPNTLLSKQHCYNAHDLFS